LLQTKGRKPEDAPKETPNPAGVASPPKLGRNPQQPDAEAALEPKTTTPTNTGSGNQGKTASEATPTLSNTDSGNKGKGNKPDKAAKPTENTPTPNSGKGKPNSGKDIGKTTTNQSPNNGNKGKANKKNKNKKKQQEKQQETSGIQGRTICNQYESLRHKELLYTSGQNRGQQTSHRRRAEGEHPIGSPNFLRRRGERQNTIPYGCQRHELGDAKRILDGSHAKKVTNPR